MPRGDRTGPLGLGPRTGRAAGYCGGHGMPGFMNPYGGQAFGGGPRLGFGWGSPAAAYGYGGSPYPSFGPPGRGFGRGLGFGRGRGWGRGRGFYPFAW
jgi:hypothetical protein